MTPFPFHHILFIIMGNMFSMHNAFNLSNKSLFNNVKFKLYDSLGVYWKTINFLNLPCVLGTICSVNKVLVFCVYPHIVVLESHLSCLKLHNTQKKQALFVHALNLDSCNLHVNFLETQRIKLIVLHQRN